VAWVSACRQFPSSITSSMDPRVSYLYLWSLFWCTIQVDHSVFVAREKTSQQGIKLARMWRTSFWSELLRYLLSLGKVQTDSNGLLMRSLPTLYISQNGSFH
jgi:hypothetical protein